MWSKFYCAYHPVQPSGSCGLVTDGPSALKHHSVQRPYFAGASPPAHFRSLCSNDFAVLFTDTVPTRSVNEPDTSRSQLLLEQRNTVIINRVSVSPLRLFLAVGPTPILVDTVS